MMPWFSPDALDREHWRWTRWKPQHGGWDQEMWVRLQETWRSEVETWAQPWRVALKEATSN